MNKLSIFSAILFWIVFWVSLFLVLAYITETHGVREFGFDGWIGHLHFAWFIFFFNACAWFFPVYYLQIISYIRKSQRETEHMEDEPYFYDSSSFRNKIKNKFKRHLEKDKRRFIWHFKDNIRHNREKVKEKQDKKSKPINKIYS
jgi:hypothetical protein